MVKRESPITIGTTVTPICAINPNRTSLIILNNDPLLTLYVGTDSMLSVLTGLPISPGQSLILNVGLGDEPNLGFFGISPSATIDCRTFEEYAPQKVS